MERIREYESGGDRGGPRPDFKIKRIFDPIHHFIELDHAEVALIDTAPMQRLRRLRQIGLAYLAFPAAEHSRFTHALGALATGDRILESLRRHDDGYFTDQMDFENQRKLLRASLLLHDVGHGPFSHASEAVLERRHELRTEQILALPEIENALDAIGVDPEQVLALVLGDPLSPYPVLREIVSGPNLDADRMDYLLRDAYFTGVASGRYDADQLLGSLRVFDRFGKPALGVDGRGIVSLESFVLARYMMFSTVYFHHTTRQFERSLHTALRRIWPDPRALDPIEEFLAWDDFRVLESVRFSNDPGGRAIMDRESRYAMVAEFNAERDLSIFETTFARLRDRFGDAVWADTLEQSMHRMPLSSEGRAGTVLVRTHAGLVDARDASDLIARITGKAYWRKIFVDRSHADVPAARTLARELVADRSISLFG